MDAQNLVHPPSPPPAGPTLILGASADIGIELIRELRSGPSPILAHYHRSKAKLAQFSPSPPLAPVIPIQSDLALPSDVDHLIHAVLSHHGIPSRIIFLAAPKFEYVRFKDLTWNTFQLNLDVQLRALFSLCHAFLPQMAKSRCGKVLVVLSSVTIGLPPAALAHYVTTKYAVLGFLRSLAVEFATHHITVNAVSPSMIETSFLEKLPPRMVEIAASQSPLRRNGVPADVVGVIRFLLSPEADYITGANIPITGGTAF